VISVVLEDEEEELKNVLLLTVKGLSLRLSNDQKYFDSCQHPIANNAKIPQILLD